jgi:hypothetical protein
MIMVFTKLEEHKILFTKDNGDMIEKKSGFPDFGATRTVGFYYEKETALDAVHNNAGDMNETVYDYAIVEEVEPGLYPCSTVRWLYKFDYKTKQYNPIEEPEILSHMCGIVV